MRRRLASALILASAAAFNAFAADSPDVEPALAEIAKLRAGGDLPGAAAKAADLVAKHPESLDAHVVRQDLEIALGHEKEIIETYRAAAKAPDAKADAHYLCARLLRGGAAVTEFRAALTADPAHFWAMCGLASELTRTKSFNEAKAALDEAMKLRPDSAVPLNAMGRLEEGRGKLADAEKWYRAAVERDATMAIARVNLGAVLVLAGKPADALKILDEAAKLAPDDPMPLLGLGAAYAASKDFKSASDAYRRALALDETDVNVMNLLANAYMDQDLSEPAEMLLQQALRRAPSNSATNATLAHLRVSKELYDEALKYALAAVQADDASPDAHYVLGLAYDHLVQPKKADAEFRRAEKLDPENPAFARAVGALACGMGDFKTAIDEYSKVVKMTNGSITSLMELAGAFVGANKGTQAAQTYEQVLATEPGNLDAMLQLGIVAHRDLKDMKRALKIFKDYVAKGGKDARVPLWVKEIEAAGK